MIDLLFAALMLFALQIAPNTDDPITASKQKRADLRYRVKQMTKRSTTARSLSHLLQKLNPTLRGWGTPPGTSPGNTG